MKKNDSIIKGLQNEVDTTKSRLTVAEATVKELEDQVMTLTDEITEIRKVSTEQSETLKKLENSDNERQAEKRRANILIDGIPEETNGPLTNTVKSMLVDIGITVQDSQILAAFRIGNVTRKNNKRPRTIYREVERSHNEIRDLQARKSS